MHMLYIISMLLSLSCGNRDDIVDKSKLLGNDYRLFQGTPVWNLAKAVQDEDVEEIKHIAKEDSIDIDYQEGKFGQTLLMLAVENLHYNSCATLLKLGANPNQPNTYSGSSAMIDAAAINSAEGIDIKFLKLLLEYGGNPNFEEVGERRRGNTTRMTPLLKACRSLNRGVSPLEKVKLLVDAGADINYKNEYNQFALKEALVQGNYDVAIFLLQTGADYSHVFFDRSEFTKDGKKLYIADVLREDLLPLDSKEYQYKMEIVEFLKEKGIDYRTLPIPNYVKKEAKETYGKGWKEYLEKY